MNKYVNMQSFGESLRTWRGKQGKTKQELSMLAGIDQALISKYERGLRLPSEKHVARLAKATGLPLTDLRRQFLADKIARMVQYEVDAREILSAAESRAEYLRSGQSLPTIVISPEILGKLGVLDGYHKQWNQVKPLSGVQLAKLQEYFSVRYTYDSNRIEGNTLTLQETHLVIHEGITISGKSLREHLEAINHADAIEWVKSLVHSQEDVNKRNVLDLHRLILRSIDSENAGRFRMVPVRISGSEHIPPAPYILDKMMEDYFLHYEYQKKILHPALLAAEMHERLVSIHPFIDGNGRTARLLMNFILLRHGYPIVILKGDPDARMTYYRALEKVQIENDPEPFYHLIIDHAILSLQEHLEMI